MAKVFRSKFMQKWLFLGVAWALGLCAVGWATPVGPRDGWLIPYGQQVLGFLSDGKTLLCQDHPESRSENLSRSIQLLSLWDYENGKFIKKLPILFDTKVDYTLFYDPFSGKDWIYYTQALTPLPDRKPGEKWSLPEKRRFVLSVYDALSGKPISRFEYTAQYSWMLSSYDGKKLALQNVDDEGHPVLRVYDIASSTLKTEIQIEGISPIGCFACFSWDSSKLAVRMLIRGKNASSQPNMRIYESETGKVITELEPTVIDIKKHGSDLFFSFDDRLITDKGAVFDAATGKKKYELSKGYATFTPDSKYLISTAMDGDRVWLVFADAQSGADIPEKRICLPRTEGTAWSLWFLRSNQRHLIVKLLGRLERKLSSFEKLLIKLPRMDWLQWEPPTFIIIDYPTGQLIAEEHQEHHWNLPPDGRSFLASASNGSGTVRWDMPSTRPWISLLLSWTVWSLIFWLIQNRIFMILRMTKTSPSSVAP